MKSMIKKAAGRLNIGKMPKSLRTAWMFGTTMLIAGEGKHVSTDHATDRDIRRQTTTILPGFPACGAAPSICRRPWENRQKSLAPSSLRGIESWNAEAFYPANMPARPRGRRS